MAGVIPYPLQSKTDNRNRNSNKERISFPQLSGKPCSYKNRTYSAKGAERSEIAE